MTLTQERLKELLHYDPETGLFVRLRKTKKSAVGSVAGSSNSAGYLVIRVDEKVYYAHRLAILYVTGEWPTAHMDHIDGDRSNNRYSNIRDVSATVNGQNRRSANKSSSTGLLGAHRKRSRFASRIVVDGTEVSLGRFDSPEEAHAAYIAAKRKHHEGNTL